MDWVILIFPACGLILLIVLIQALRKGVLFTHKGPDLKRAERPKTFWVVFVSYASILACCVWNTIAWAIW